ncbi:hypothetical protein B0H34DRAFT_700687 [Crassisporium funariophilum]|nr:hypothetical protein B0H34DRAFT_700687 [Crassisporium funariophilum]
MATTSSQPRSSRVQITYPASPPLPARSPLRPPGRSISNSTSTTSFLTQDSLPSPRTPPLLDSDDFAAIAEAYTMNHMNMRERHNSFPSLNGLIDPLQATEEGLADPLSQKNLPVRPDSPISLNLEDDPEAEPVASTSTASSSSAPSVAHPPTMTKRHHALHELLSSERAYASDLALIREVHIPLALGQTVPLHNTPISPPNSSGSSSRTLSTSSDSSTASLGPPMTTEDVKIIFSNIPELAMFSDLFGEELELALGSVVEGGHGEDFVGELFLRIIPELERPYKQYITRHPSATQHLTNLPQTPALTAYLAYTQSVASSLSHAWDISSLLIKPVQRLLKYPLLLGAIIDETPDSHPDKENLRTARVRMEEVARNVNEERRRAEVVKDVLTSKKGGKPAAGVAVAAGVNLSKMKSLRHGGVGAATKLAEAGAAGTGAAGDDIGGSEAARVDYMQAELKRIDVFAQQFAKSVVDWGKMMSHVMVALRVWSISFGHVIGLSPEQGSEAFDAFLEVIEKQLMPLTTELEAAINERLLKDMAHLLMTMNQPLKLLASMNEQEPYHYHLLTMPMSAKNRPPPSLLAASTNYLALRGQLAAELPTYLALLHKGFEIFVRRLAEIQMRFWGHVRERWGILWEMLRVEGELNAGWEETVGVWRVRWGDVDEVMRALGVVQPPVSMTSSLAQLSQKSVARQSKEQPKDQQRHLHDMDEEEFWHYQQQQRIQREREQLERQTPATQIQQQYYQQQQQPRPQQQQQQQQKQKTKVATVHAMFAALEPAHSPTHKKAPPPAVNVANTMNMLGALAPSTANLHSATSGHGPSAYAGSMYSVSSPMPLGTGRPRGGSEAYTQASGSSGAPGRRGESQESRRENKEAKSPARRSHGSQGHGLGIFAEEEDMEEYVAVSPGGPGTSAPPPYENGRHQFQTTPSKGIPRTKSMPLKSLSNTHAHSNSFSSTPSTKNANANADLMSINTNATARTSRNLSSISGSGGGYVVEGDQVFYQPPLEVVYDEYQAYLDQKEAERQQREKERERENRERGRQPRERPGRSQAAPAVSSVAAMTPITKPTTKKDVSPKRKSKERPTHARKRSGSVKSITSFFTSSSTPATTTTTPSDPQPLTASQRDSWVHKPAKYICQVIHPCKPPSSVSYYSFPFFTLAEGSLYEVLQEAGHPSIHPKLPLYVDDGEDCLLLCRDGRGCVGWALASFLEPVTMGLGKFEWGAGEGPGA